MNKQYFYRIRKNIAVCTAIALPILSVLAPIEKITGHPASGVQTAQAKAKVRLNKTSLKLKVGASIQLRIVGTKKKVSWKSSKKSVATVSAKGKVKAKSVGKAKITAKVAGKKYVCKVSVSKKAAKPNTSSQNQNNQTSQDSQSSQTSQTNQTSQINQVVSLINQERKANGVPTIETDAQLQAAAGKRAQEIAEKFDHTRPNGSSCFTILEEYNISYRACGENIAYGQPNAESVMNSWMNSPGHRSNILNASYGRVGVGLYIKSGTCYWVQLFTN